MEKAVLSFYAPKRAIPATQQRKELVDRINRIKRWIKKKSFFVLAGSQAKR